MQYVFLNAHALGLSVLRIDAAVHGDSQRLPCWYSP